MSILQLYNPLQNIWRKIKKSRKNRQHRKILTSVFPYFLSVIAKKLFLQGRLDTGLCLVAVLRFYPFIFLFLKILRPKSFGTGEATHK